MKVGDKVKLKKEYLPLPIANELYRNDTYIIEKIFFSGVGVRKYFHISKIGTPSRRGRKQVWSNGTAFWSEMFESAKTVGFIIE